MKAAGGELNDFNHKLKPFIFGVTYLPARLPRPWAAGWAAWPGGRVAGGKIGIEI